MSFKNVEEVGISLLDAQSMEIQILKEENDEKVQQKFNTSTCSVCNKDTTNTYISCSECRISTHSKCTFLPSTQFYYLVKKKSKYMCINCMLTDLVDLSSDGGEVLINDIKEDLAEIQTKNNLFQGLYRFFLVSPPDFPQNYTFFLWIFS